MNASELLALANRNGGWTVNYRNGDIPDYGYSVGGHPDIPETRIPHWRDRHGPVLLALVTGYLDRLSEHGENVTGGWVSGDALVLDAPTIVGDREAAMDLGRERGEEAIYCLHTGETITL